MQSRNAGSEAGPSPLTARSVLASTLLGADPPELPVSHLVHMTGLFAINENRTRVALSRMVASGEATTDGNGRYRLAGHLLDRQRRQAVSRRGAPGGWEGGWHTVIIGADRRAPDHRAERRRQLRALRLAERRDGTWLRPDNLAIEIPPGLADDLLVVSGGSVADPAGLAASLWDLDGWSARADQLLVELDQLPPDTADRLAPGFVLSAAVLRHLQADPLLPAALRPAGWAGDRLRRCYDDWDHRYRQVLGRWAVTAPGRTTAARPT